MRLYSTPESALRQEITALAICETISCVVLYLVVEAIWNPGLLPWVVIGAPLFLAQTRKSRNYGKKLYKQVNKYHQKFSDRHFLIGFSLIALIPIAGVMIRIFSTLICALRHPLETLASFSGNWIRQVLATDFRHPPEIVPGEMDADTIRSSVTIFGINELLKRILFKQKTFRRSFMAPFLVIVLMIGYIPSWLYRISFKATSLVYAPFVLIAHITLRSALPLKDRLKRFKGELEKTGRWLSGALLALLVAKGAVFFEYMDLTWLATKVPSEQLIEAVIQPETWPWWQVALAGASLLTFALSYFADAALARIDGEKRVWKDSWVRNTISSASFVRAILAILAMAHGFSFAWQQANAFEVLARLLAWLPYFGGGGSL